ncbi:MAG: hypothetical protein WA751_06755 [Candidatus Dormiibacterota bacterium]
MVDAYDMAEAEMSDEMCEMTPAEREVFLAHVRGGEEIRDRLESLLHAPILGPKAARLRGLTR